MMIFLSSAGVCTVRYDLLDLDLASLGFVQHHSRSQHRIPRWLQLFVSILNLIPESCTLTKHIPGTKVQVVIV